MNPRHKHMIYLLLLIVTVITACGQKGSLYLPDEKQTALTAPEKST